VSPTNRNPKHEAGADHGREKEHGREEPEFQVIDGKEREGIVE